MSIADSVPGSIPLERPDPIIRADRIGWIIFEKSDVAEARRFLEDFGLVHAADAAEGALFRGAGTLPYVYVVRPGTESRFVGTGFIASGRDDLVRLAERTGRPIEPIDRPGGGECVRLTDPHGFLVEVAWGVAEVEPLEIRTTPLALNTPFEKPRVNATQRPPLRPSAVVKLGHCVIQSTDCVAVASWYMKHLGLIATDVQCAPDGNPALAFMRTDRGPLPSDHHAFVVGFGFRDEFLHCAFEVLDIDELGQGHQVLRRGGWKHAWGIGRHVLGSQLFDYWRDADGFEHEHYADGDVFDADHPTEYSELSRGGLWQWGADLPSDFGPQMGPGLIFDVARGLLAGTVDLAKLGSLAAAMRRPPRPWLS